MVEYVKQFVGLARSNESDDLIGLANKLYDNDIDKMAGDINDFFHSVSGDFPPLDDSILKTLDVNDYEDTIIYPWQVEQKLSNICSYKAAGSDGLPHWFLKEMAPFVTKPICAIFNASITQVHVPDLWRQANVIPAPNIPPPKSVGSDLRPMSRTATLSKILELFVLVFVLVFATNLTRTSLVH